MTDSDLDEYLPRATREQRVAVKAYHGAGWTIELMLPNSDDIEMRRDVGEWMDHAVIHPNGHVSSR